MFQQKVAQRDDLQRLDGLEPSSTSNDVFSQSITVEVDTTESVQHSKPAATIANRVEISRVTRRKISKSISEEKMKNKMYECFECHQTFSVLRSLRKHSARAHSGDIFKCDSCDKQFKHRDNLKQHKMTHSLRGTKKKRRVNKKKKSDIICKQCNVKFTKASSLKRHNNKHNK